MLRRIIMILRSVSLLAVLCACWFWRCQSTWVSSVLVWVIAPLCFSSSLGTTSVTSVKSMRLNRHNVFPMQLPCSTVHLKAIGFIAYRILHFACDSRSAPFGSPMSAVASSEYRLLPTLATASPMSCGELTWNVWFVHHDVSFWYWSSSEYGKTKGDLEPCRCLTSKWPIIFFWSAVLRTLRHPQDRVSDLTNFVGVSFVSCFRSKGRFLGNDGLLIVSAVRRIT